MINPKLPEYRKLAEQIELYANLKSEYGAKGIGPILASAEKAMTLAVARLRRLPASKDVAARQPNNLKGIRALRPKGPRRLWKSFDPDLYREKLSGALLARMAGCTLGAPVEGWSIQDMSDLARETHQPFPPTDYWPYVPRPFAKRYQFSERQSYTRDSMDGVPVDDDIAYTLLGLLVVEDFGPDFTVAENGKAWLKYLPYACTAEKVALANLKNGVPAAQCGEKENPYCEWIGADIRSDPWGYMAPGWPEFAANMAYRDAYLSHRRNGIYGEMFFSAAIAAAFTVDHPVRAIELALGEIPARCELAKAVRWALKLAPRIKDYRQARAAVNKQFLRVSGVHTINNACLTIWGLTIGGRDVTKVIGQTVAMGMDNDCTAATAGSIVGAVVGRKGVPPHWYKRFNNTVHSYLINRRKFTIDGLVTRFTRQAKRVYER